MAQTYTVPKEETTLQHHVTNAVTVILLYSGRVFVLLGPKRANVYFFEEMTTQKFTI